MGPKDLPKTVWGSFRAISSADTPCARKDIFDPLLFDRSFDGIPKLHSLLHYSRAIRLLGTLDGYSTETPERLHIDCAKVAYRASNRVNYVPQMATYLSRQEAMHSWTAYMTWRTGKDFSLRVDNDEPGVDEAAAHDQEGEEYDDISEEKRAEVVVRKLPVKSSVWFASCKTIILLIIFLLSRCTAPSPYSTNVQRANASSKRYNMDPGAPQNRRLCHFRE